ncbi:Niemann-Pick type C-2f [Arctopsyche grandis]|uniref:Niemann-Pick type C-2f n=1 Tax=Arctopsyche grandis TaxID=121162 RepID=UPI00406D8340
MAMKKLIIFLLAVTFVCGGNVIFEDCGSAYEIETVDIEGCERTVPCHISIGAKTNVTVTYTAGFVSHALSQLAVVTLNSVQRETVVSPRACEATWCPVQTHNINLYRARMEMPTNLALNSRGTLNWSITNEFAKRLVCFTVTIQTRSPLNEYLKNLIFD